MADLQPKPSMWWPGIRSGHPLARGLVGIWLPEYTGGWDLTRRHALTLGGSPPVVGTPFGRAWCGTDALAQYIKLPSLTARSVTMMGLWVANANDFFIDARTGLVNGYVYTAAVGAGWAEVYQNGIDTAAVPTQSQWCVWTLNATGGFTDDVNVFAKNNNLDRPVSWYLLGLYVHSRSLSAGEAREAGDNSWGLVTPRKRTYSFLQAGLAKALFDTLALADAPAKAIAAVHAESLGIGDAIGKAAGSVRADSLALSDARISAIAKAFAEGLALADATTKSVGKRPADILALTDAIAKATDMTRADVLALADAVAKQAGLVQTETLTLADRFAPDWAIILVLLSALATEFTMTSMPAQELTLTSSLAADGTLTSDPAEELTLTSSLATELTLDSAIEGG